MENRKMDKFDEIVLFYTAVLSTWTFIKIMKGK